MNTDDRRQRVGDACAALLAAGQSVTFEGRPRASDPLPQLRPKSRRRRTPRPRTSSSHLHRADDTTSAPAANPSSATVPVRGSPRWSTAGPPGHLPPAGGDARRAGAPIAPVARSAVHRGVRGDTHDRREHLIDLVRSRAVLRCTTGSPGRRYGSAATVSRSCRPAPRPGWPHCARRGPAGR